MEDNIMLKIKTYQDIENDDGEEPIELETPGKFGIINGKYYLKYRESEMTGYGNTVTTVKVWDDNVIVTRRGDVEMKLCYVKGEQKLCLYPTPYGKIGVSIKTHSVDFDFDKENGWLRVDYSIDADNTNCYKSSLNIKTEPLICKAGEEKPKIHKITGTV